MWYANNMITLHLYQDLHKKSIHTYKPILHNEARTMCIYSEFQCMSPNCRIQPNLQDEIFFSNIGKQDRTLPVSVPSIPINEQSVRCMIGLFLTDWFFLKIRLYVKTAFYLFSLMCRQYDFVFTCVLVMIKVPL